MLCRLVSPDFTSKNFKKEGSTPAIMHASNTEVAHSAHKKVCPSHKQDLLQMKSATQDQ